MITMCILVLLNQILFIGLRTKNVQSIAKNNIVLTVITGIIIHFAWLFGISVGADAGIQLLNGNYSYIPIVVCSTVGGVIGTLIAMKWWKK